MISKVVSLFSFSGNEELETQHDQVPAHEEMKVLLLTCIDTGLEIDDKVALYLKACIKVYNKEIKGNSEIMKNWKDFMQKFIIAKACEFKVLRDVRIKAEQLKYSVCAARMKKDTNPKNVVVAIGLIPEHAIDDLLYK